jgi:drug/metabolite transporter (DMT)-like permease
LGVNAFAATQIRVLAGLAGFFIIASVMGSLTGIARTVYVALCPTKRLPVDARSLVPELRRALALLLVGAVLGPFLGVSLGLLSAQRLPTGVASTLMSIEPVLLVPLSVAVFHEKVTRFEILGTFVALVGVAILGV